MVLSEALQRWAACLDMHSAKACTLAAGDGWLVLGLLCLVFIATGIGRKLVMAAVRLARFNTRRKLIVCFAGAYHGWWDGVQPGLGSERSLDDCLTLKDLHPAALAVIRQRAKEIAGVLVNPVQAFHPNSPHPGLNVPVCPVATPITRGVQCVWYSPDL